MVEWLAGNRIRGTSTERASGDFNNHLTGVGAVGGWKEVGRTKLGSSNSNIDVTSLPDKRYYMVLTDILGSSAGANKYHRLGNGSIDSGSNYAWRKSEDGGADPTPTTTTTVAPIQEAGYSGGLFAVTYYTNLASKEKLQISHSVANNSTGVGNVPHRSEFASKWVSTSVIDQIRATTASSTTFDSDSEVVVLGWDPDDTHTTNFWEELADVSWTSGSTFATPTFTAKKYLWIQMYKAGTASSNISCRLNFNDDNTTGGNTNYNRRLSSNGGADWVGAGTGYDGIHLSPTNSTVDYCNIFMVNNSANEKLIMSHIVNQSTAGSGTAPNRMELVGKWVTTGSQVTKVHMTSVNDALIAGSRIKVWGHD